MNLNVYDEIFNQFFFFGGFNWVMVDIINYIQNLFWIIIYKAINDKYWFIVYISFCKFLSS